MRHLKSIQLTRIKFMGDHDNHFIRRKIGANQKLC